MYLKSLSILAKSLSYLVELTLTIDLEEIEDEKTNYTFIECSVKYNLIHTFIYDI